MEKVSQAVEKLKTDFQSHPDYANQMKITADRLRSKKQYALADSITNLTANLRFFFCTTAELRARR